MDNIHFMEHQVKALDETEKYNKCAYYLDLHGVR